MDRKMQKDVFKILVVRFSSLGDIVLTTPVIQALKSGFPNSHIFFLTKTQYADLFRDDLRMFSVSQFDKDGKHKGLRGFLRLVRELRSHDFDLLIDLHANLRSSLVRHLTKSEVKLKYDKRRLSRFLMVGLKFLKTKPVRTIDSYLGVLEKLDIAPSDKAPYLYLSKADIEFSEHFLLEEKVKKDDIVVGVHPGARWETKRWDEAKFRQVCQVLVRKVNCKILLLGDAGDKELIERISTGMPAGTMVKATGLPLRKLMSLIKRCACLVANDSGPMQIAWALQVPVVAIFGPTHPHLGFAPTGANAVILCANVKCSPCSLHGKRRCHKKARLCMDLITPEMAIEAVERLLPENKLISKES
ncbi:MAG: glycosyltransferase family 9 protein [Candidatus Zixiibacteriota bacterium]